MGKPLILSRKDVSARMARAIGFMVDAAAITVSITWVDEQQDMVGAETHQATAYGDTSAGRPLGSLPGDVALQAALGHYAQIERLAQEGSASLIEQVAKLKAEEEAKAAAGEEESEENDPMVAAAVEAVTELAEPHEEANADAHE